MPTAKQIRLARWAGEMTYAYRKLSHAAADLASDHPAIANRINTFLAILQTDTAAIVTESGIQAPQPESYENG